MERPINKCGYFTGLLYNLEDQELDLICLSTAIVDPVLRVGLEPICLEEPHDPGSIKLTTTAHDALESTPDPALSGDIGYTLRTSHEQRPCLVLGE